MRKHLGAVLFAAALVVAPLEFCLAGGGGPSANDPGPTGAISGELLSPTAAAKSAYYQGLSSVRRAQMYDAEAAKASTPEKYASAHGKAQKSYAASLASLIEAVTIQPTLFQAWNNMGFSNFHLGNYDDSVSAYTKALELSPNNPDAVRYRGEALLGLNQIEDAKAAYMALLRDSPALADELMTSMRRWTDAHRQDAQGLSPADVESLAKWIDERAAIAAHTARR